MVLPPVLYPSSAPLPLDAPANVSASVDNAAGEIEVTWTDQSDGESDFVVERTDDGGSTWTQVHTEPSTTSTGTGSGYSWTDTGASADTTYQYRVKATDPNTPDSSYSTSGSVSTDPIPADPTNVAANFDSGFCEVDITWTDNATVEQEYEVWRDGTRIADSLAADTTSYTEGSIDDKGLENTTPTYEVRAVNGWGWGSGSDSESIGTCTA